MLSDQLVYSDFGFDSISEVRIEKEIIYSGFEAFVVNKYWFQKSTGENYGKICQNC